MNKDVIHNAMSASLAGTIAFPDVVRALMAEGVERYTVDLVRMQKTTYLPSGESDVFDFPFTGTPAERFDQPAVLAAIRASQAQQIRYTEFLARVLAAGTVGYSVYLQGRRAIYVGRNGEQHIEEFPKAP